jgi:hypothetical protein
MRVDEMDDTSCFDLINKKINTTLHDRIFPRDAFSIHGGRDVRTPRERSQ